MGVANNLAAGLHNVTITDANGCALVKEFFIDCPDRFKVCDDGNPNTYGDHIDIECNCVGKVITCDNGLDVSNVVLGKTATQSSTNGAGVANRAIDGNRDGVFNNGSVAATNVVEDFNAWWQVDLEKEIDINQILINNRTDCCTGRLEDYQVFISTTPFTSDDLETTRNQAGIVWTHDYQNATPLPDTLIELNATGRYVRIQSTSDRPLNLAEVGIFACGVPLGKALTANPLGENDYELKGFVIPSGATVTSVTVEHGINDFANSQPIDITTINDSDTFNVNTVVNIGSATNYQFRIKFNTATDTYYSNIFNFVVNSAYCTPTVDNELGYKEFRKVALNSLTYDGNSDNYEDATDFSFGEFIMGGNYDIALTTPADWWFNLTFLVYIDLNNDGDFTDYNEIVGTSGPINQTTNFEVTIPTTDVLVNRDLRMRILGHEGGAYTTCYSPVGNFKDFTIRIKAGDCVQGGHLVPFFVDADNDGFGGEILGVTRNCSVTAVDGYVNNSEDCDDTNPNVHPNSEGICDDGITTISSSISSGDDDVEERTSNGSINTASSDLELVVDGVNQTVGLQFRNLAIPNQAIITNAYIQFTTDEGGSEATDLVIHAENQDSCHSFTTTPFDVSKRDMTTNAVNWLPPSWSIFNAAAADQQTPDLSALVQEVVNRTGWKSGNPMSFIITGTGKRTAHSYNGSAAKAPKLFITYTELCTFYKDKDGDGYGDPNDVQTSINCAYLFPDYVTDNTDFDDTNKNNYPNALEICDNIDNDGDNEVDEGADYDSESTMFTNETLPSETYTARTTIETNQTVDVMPNTDVHLIAGQSITLKAGFSVAAGAEFLAQIIEDCAAPFQENEVASSAKITDNTTVVLNGQITLTAKEIEQKVVDNQLIIRASPNPFRAQTTITFSLVESTPVTLQVYGINGQVIRTLINKERYDSGDYKIDFSVVEEMNGMYYFVLQTEIGVLTEKVVVLGR